MPPRKKAKASTASTPLTEAQPKTPQGNNDGDVDMTDAKSSPIEDRLNDPWTTEQETQLFKSMMRWKPTGIHKHLRIICIHNNMRSLGFAPEDAQHTRIPGLWRKIGQFYKLDALDEREDLYAFQDDPDPFDPAEAYDIADFELPEEEYGQLMWQKRFHGPESAASSSPAPIPVEEDKSLYHPGIGLLRDLPEGAKLRTTATPPPPKNTKSTRASRAATKNAKSKAAAKGRVPTESAEEDEEDEEEEEEEEEESEEEAAPTTRRTNRGRGKPTPKRTRKR